MQVKNKLRGLVWIVTASLLLQGCKTTGKVSNSALIGLDSAIVVQFSGITVSDKPIYQGSQPVLWKLSHTRLEVKPIWNKKEIEGRAVLTLSPNAYPQDSLLLDARNFIIHSVSAGKNTIAYSYDSSMLHIRLPHIYQPDEELEVTVTYTAQPYLNEKYERYSSPITRGIYFINADGKDSLIPQELWSQGETHYNSGWFPTIDDPQQKQTQEVYITVDPRFTTISNGDLSYSSYNQDGTRTDCWQTEKPSSTYLTMIAVGNWKKVSDEWRDSIPVDYYVEPAYVPYARKIFDRTPEMLEFYSQLLGVDYPWEAFRQVVARDFVAGAMENTTAVVHFEGLQQDDRGLLDANYEEYICHELFHHWFGDLVTPESWANLCLSESFATFGENLWIAHRFGSDQEELQRQKELNSYFTDVDYRTSPLVDYYYKSPEDLFDHVRYEKGALILIMLRNKLGDDVFYNGLRIYLTRHAYGNAEVADLRMALEEASGLDLQEFFNQWFFRTGHPSVNLAYYYNDSTKNLVITCNQIQGRDKLFNFPLDVDIYSDKSHTSRYQLNISHAADSLIIPMANLPQTIVFDPEKILLAQKNIMKTPQDWYNQYFMTQGYLNKFEALEGMYRQNILQLSENEKRTLIFSTAHDKFWKMRQLAYTDLLTSTNAPVDNADFILLADSTAKVDPNSAVRAAALLYLSHNEGSRKLDLYEEKLSDSSYEVCATALHALSLYMPKLDSAKLLTFAQPFEKTNWPSIAMELSAIYSHYPAYRQAAFFHWMPYYIRSVQMGKMVDIYKKWLFALPTKDIAKESNFILAVDSQIKDVWSAASYKVLLQETATHLEKATDNSGEYSEIIDSFRAKADSLILKAKY